MRKTLFYRSIISTCLVFLAMQALARSGGGGGDFSSGDGDGGGLIVLLEIVYYIFVFLPFPINFIALGVLILLIFLGSRKYKQSSSLNTIAKINTGFMSESELKNLSGQITGFNETEFLKKARFAFEEIQKGWVKKDLKEVRKFMSDGIYQRYHAQFLMMKALLQTNEITKLNILETRLAYIEKEDDFDIVHVQFKAEISERYVSTKYKNLNQSYNEEFLEFWTFVRKKGSQEKDIFFSNNCPKCGDALPADMGEISKCPSCGTYTNTGEFDWILCEITQPEEFIGFVNGISSRKYLIKRLGEYKNKLPNTGVQLLEDKASNAYIQLRIAHALNDMTRIRRFSEDSFYASVAETKHESFLFNRFYLRDVGLINIFENKTHYFAAFSIQCKEQKVRIVGDDVKIMDAAMISVPVILTLTIARDNVLSAHSVLAHSCTQCGGPVGDTTNLTCQYCGHILNDDKRDWILCGLFSKNEYDNWKRQFETSMVKPKKEENLADFDLHSRDYAINNMMVIMMADGTLSDEERDLAVKMAKKLGFNSKKIAGLWESTNSAKMSIIMPDDKKTQQKVYKFMKKAAKVDGIISEKEQAILDDVVEKYQLENN